MTFEGKYLTYNEYRELGGPEIGEMPFNLLEFEARRKINIRTQDRLLNGDEEIPQEVKLCDFKMINSIINYANTKNSVASNGISSENTDGYSISYMSPSEITNIVNSMNYELDDIMMTYLLRVIYNGEHLMYVGVK